MKVELGKIVDDSAYEHHRDAVHVPVILVEAGEDMAGGEHIGVLKDSSSYVVGTKAKRLIGIVDPFLKGVGTGQKFWMWMDPDQVTSVQHKWYHADLSDNSSDSDNYDDPCRGCY
jgi:hypothetical protein